MLKYKTVFFLTNSKLPLLRRGWFYQQKNNKNNNKKNTKATVKFVHVVGPYQSKDD